MVLVRGCRMTMIALIQLGKIMLKCAIVLKQRLNLIVMSICDE
jgi:hypothetical protein